VHVVARLSRNFLRLALAFVRAHSIEEQMGMHKVLDGAAFCNEVLFVELEGESINA
jgi:hypothetical protein